MLKIENIQRIDLGIQGENLSRAIEIDCSTWAELIPNGNISIYHKRPGDTALEVTGATYDSETKILRWEPTSFDTYYDGTGAAEIRITEDEIVKKSFEVVTVIHAALVSEGSGTIESNQQAYIDAIDQIRSQIASASGGATAASAEETEETEEAEEAEEPGTAAGNGTAGGAWQRFTRTRMKVERIQRLDLGIQGENLSRAIEIDCNLWKDMFPNGHISLYHKRPGETAQDVTGAVCDEDGILRWEPTSYDTYYEGIGVAEIRITENQIVKKSIPLETIIHPTLHCQEDGMIESNQQAYIDAIDQIRSRIDEYNTQTAEAAESAGESAEAAEASAEEAEAWARGSRGGTDVESTDTTYQNNARYYAEEAGSSATAANTSRAAADQAKAEAKIRANVSQASYTDANGNYVVMMVEQTQWQKADGTVIMPRANAIGYAGVAREEAVLARRYATNASSSAEAAAGSETAAAARKAEADRIRAEAAILAKEDSAEYTDAAGETQTVTAPSAQWQKADLSFIAIKQNAKGYAMAADAEAGVAKAYAQEAGDIRDATQQIKEETEGIKEETEELLSSKADKTNTVLETTLSRGRKSGTTAGTGSMAFGDTVTASGNYTNAEGRQTVASGTGAHAEGYRTTASNSYSHAEGEGTAANGGGAHAEGYSTKATGNYSHAEGYSTNAKGTFSHAEGEGTVTKHRDQHALGAYNIEDPSTNSDFQNGTYLEIVGNGTNASNRSNAYTLDWNGNGRFKGSVYAGCAADSTGGSKLMSEADIMTTAAMTTMLDTIFGGAA